MAKVIRRFLDKFHDHVYEEGDTYPAKGHKADKERVSFLSKKHPDYGVAFLAVEEQEDKDEKETTKTKNKSKKK